MFLSDNFFFLPRPRFPSILSSIIGSGHIPDGALCVRGRLFDYVDKVSNYRPVSSLSILSKVVKRCNAVKMIDYFEGNGLFSERQFGFRSGR